MTLFDAPWAEGEAALVPLKAWLRTTGEMHS